MVITSANEVAPKIESNYDRASELKAFDETKSSGMGLLESGIRNVPQVFIQPPDIFANNTSAKNIHFTIPTKDLETDLETYGFFQVVNHGIQVRVPEEMLIGVHSFYEQDAEVKKQFYTCDMTGKVVYNSNYDLYSSPAASWRDTSTCFMAANPPKPEELPAACISVEHRVVAKHEGPRISAACFFSTSLVPSSKLHGPIEELLSEDNPPKYRETTVHEFVLCFHSKGPEGSLLYCISSCRLS